MKKVYCCHAAGAAAGTAFGWITDGKTAVAGGAAIQRAANAAFSILDNKWKRVSPSITPCSDWGCGAAAHCTAAALVDNAAVAN